MKKRKEILNSVAAIAAIFALGGCNTTPTRADISKDEVKAQSIHEDAEQQRLDKKQALLEREAKEIPDWVISPPKADAQGVYGVGLGSDADVLTAMRKAKLQGLYELAKSMNAEMSGEDTMTGSGEGQYRYIVSLFVNKVNVAGTELVRQEVKPVNGVFKTYVLMRLPFAEFNHALNAERTSSQKTELEESYNRLMKRIATTPAAKVSTPTAPPTVVADASKGDVKQSMSNASSAPENVTAESPSEAPKQ